MVFNATFNLSIHSFTIGIKVTSVIIFLIVLITTLFGFSSVPDEGYTRNVYCTLGPGWLNELGSWIT
jgi:hypothetical protein